LIHSFRQFMVYLSYFWRAKKHWSWPKESEVLIFDACGEELLREHLLDWSVEVIPVRGESINIPVVLASLFASGRKSEAYFDIYIHRVKPKLVLTFIDNTKAFYRLSRRHPLLKTMFVQNGWRGYHLDVFEQLDAGMKTAEQLAVDYMLCIGQAVGEHYQRYLSGTVVAMGSLRNNRQPRVDSVDHGSIVFISQWDSKGFEIAGRFYSQDEFVGAVDRCLIGFLRQYAQQNGKELHFIPRTALGSADRKKEERHFSAILGRPCSFLEFDTQGSSYQVIDQAELVVGVDSTLLYEAAARGAKTAFFSIRGTILGVKGFDFGWPVQYQSDGSFWTNSPSPERFKAVLDYLFSVSDDCWQTELKRVSFAKLITFDQGNSILKRTLKQALQPELQAEQTRNC